MLFLLPRSPCLLNEKFKFAEDDRAKPLFTHCGRQDMKTSAATGFHSHHFGSCCGAVKTFVLISSESFFSRLTVRLQLYIHSKLFCGHSALHSLRFERLVYSFFYPFACHAFTRLTRKAEGTFSCVQSYTWGNDLKTVLVRGERNAILPSRSLLFYCPSYHEKDFGQQNDVTSRYHVVFWPRDSNTIFQGKIARLWRIVKSWILNLDCSNFGIEHF